jgi:hypothetical protein
VNYRIGFIELESTTAEAMVIPATFKMSRENGSLDFRIASLPEGNLVKLESIGRDARFGLKSGDWVEIVAPHGHASTPGPLRRVQKVDISDRHVVLDDRPSGFDEHQPLLLRRWDRAASDGKTGLELRDGTVLIREGSGAQSWLTLENGLQIQFQPSPSGNRYRSGDYWLIPMRVSTMGILWPQDGANPSTTRSGPLLRSALCRKSQGRRNSEKANGLSS